MKVNTPFSIMAFPMGPVCNLACDYCYYLHKTALYPDQPDFTMEEALLEEYTRQYLAAHPGPHVSFGWQGGEPTLRGLAFFRRAVELQEKYKPAGWTISNAFQTNGILLDDEWCAFLKKHNFLVGISIDGPPSLHDHFRKDRGGQATHHRVMRAIELLQKHNVDYNVLCVVNAVNSQHPLDVYGFFREIGAQFIQFIPMVETHPDGGVSRRSVSGRAFGKFLIAIFNAWAAHDLGDVYVQIFEEAARVLAGLPASVCVFSETCGRAPVLEHNGDLYACDHFVLPEFKLGNIQETTLAEMLSLEKQKGFGLSKRDDLPEVCRACDVRLVCNGGCLRNRIVPTADGRKLNYLCDGYQLVFRYVRPYLTQILQELRRGTPPVTIRAAIGNLLKRQWSVRRNDPCPCGSGLKYKKCCSDTAYDWP